ncbi:HNH endonuclease [Candidatus Poriferisodalis sp.]|uniref:HNH endonuclease signature motif containing protein n=1 Tax=Candidatus Poriferisodalis sp. TaxID=3101277 RepID=UPI003B02D398
MFSQVQQALDCLGAALDGVEATPTGELRRTLGLAKQLRSRVELLETKAASAVAQRERHGDGGAGLLNQIGGRSRSEAARNVRTEAELAELPAARTGVSDGEISLANAAKLAQAARKTSPDAVQGDTDLIGLAKTLPDDEFAQAAQRWTIRHQSADDLAVQHRRNRRNRHVRFWNGDDGSVQMRGSFDAEMGARIQQRLRRQAEQIRQADRRRQQHEQQHSHGAESGDAASGAAASGDGATHDSVVPGKAIRTRDQRMADALDTLLASGTAPAHSAHAASRPGESGESGDESKPTHAPNAGECEPTHAPHADGAPLTARSASAGDPPQTGPVTTPGGDPPATAGASDASIDAALFSPLERSDTPSTGAIGELDDARRAEPAAEAEPTPSIGRKATGAEIIVRADLAALTGESGGIAEICGVGPIPPSTMARLACNSDVWIEIFGDQLTPLYETVASRAPTAAQRRALIARDGACIGCGEPPGECEAHHILPCQRGGKTRLDNLVLVCWRCHDLIHDHNWQVTVRSGRYRLAPPDPAHPTEPAPQRKPKRPAPQPAAGVTPLWDDPAA